MSIHNVRKENNLQETFTGYSVYKQTNELRNT